MLKTDKVIELNFIGEKQAQKLSKLGIETLEDLLFHIPRYYKDSSNIKSLGELSREDIQTVIVTVKTIKNIRIRSGKFIQKALCYDESGEISVTWFNQPYLIKNIKVGDQIYLSGKLNPKTKKPEMISPDYEVVKQKNLHLGRIVPIYNLTKGVSVKWLRTRLDDLTEHLKGITDIKDTLEKEIKEKFDLIDLDKALREIHFPDNRNEIIESRKRLAFDELLDIYFKLLKEKEDRLNSKCPKVKFNQKDIDDLISKLPFELTHSQNMATLDIFNDYKNQYPMHRLIQGDVGSGKTIVAVIAAIPVIKSGFQVVILAPTSVLAQQHFDTVKRLIGDRFKCILQTANSKNRSEVIKSADIIIATHSILFKDEKLLKKLGLIVIDEEHRFGVEQRKQLISYSNRATRPHLLNLTATPIPRSVALTLFGQMDVSIIEKPESRKPIKTFIVPQSKRDDSKKWLKEKLNEGGQIFWICPLINESEDTEDEVKSVENMYKEVSSEFSEFKSEFLHGKIKGDKKDKILEDFKKNKTQILVSTTVIEVGIDMPNANIIIIENAENFGLAQLHQLRGRVGRKAQDAWCLLYTKLEDNKSVSDRLHYFASENNGIKIAEYDLQMRGPGEVYGTIQAGLPNLKVASFSNMELMNITREAAKIIYSKKS